MTEEEKVMMLDLIKSVVNIQQIILIHSNKIEKLEEELAKLKEENERLKGDNSK